MFVFIVVVKGRRMAWEADTDDIDLFELRENLIIASKTLHSRVNHIHIALFIFITHIRNHLPPKLY